MINDDCKNRETLIELREAVEDLKSEYRSRKVLNGAFKEDLERLERFDDDVCDRLDRVEGLLVDLRLDVARLKATTQILQGLTSALLLTVVTQILINIFR